MTEEQPGNVAIRTPDQRLRVFVSSTLAELADERAAVARAISALRLTPVLFELGARPHPPRELYRAYLAQSDIFIGLYWQRYGWVGPGMDISGLEDEFRLSHSIPRLLYVKTPAPDREPGLTAMIDELQTEGTDSYRSVRYAAGARATGARRPGPAPERAVRGRKQPGRPFGVARVEQRPAGPALTAGDLDVVDRARARHRRGLEAAREARGPAGHPHRSRRHRQDAAGDRRGRAAGRSLPAGDGVRAARFDRSARAGAAAHRRRGGRDHRGRAPALGRPGRAVRRDAHPARAGQPRTGRRRRARPRPAAGPLPRSRDPRHEPHRASASGRARVPGRPAHGACVLGAGADRAARLVARRAAVRRSSPGRPLRLRLDRRQRARRRGDLPAPRWSAAGHRARSGPRPIAGTRGIARSARKSPRRVGHRPGRSSRASTHVARDRRMERRAAR